MRLFIAFPLEQQVRDKLSGIIDDLKPACDAVKWVNRQNIHLTSRFLGETHKDQVPRIIEKLDHIAARYEPFESVIDSIGAYPNTRRPRIVWVSTTRNIDFLTKIATHVELAMQSIGFKAETKRFKAHLTLGRVKDPRRLGDLPDCLNDYKVEPIPIGFDRLVLFKSTLQRTGPIYDRLHESLLGPKNEDPTHFTG